MKKLAFLTVCIQAVATPALLFAASTSSASTSGTSATALINQLSTAFSGGNVVHQVQLNGGATWQVGNLSDSGSAALTAASTGSSQVSLSLATSGARTETQSGQGLTMACTWAGEDGTAHDIDPGSCWRPVLWFLPALSLQPSLLSSNLGAVDMGTGTVGFGPSNYRHLQAQLVLPNLTTSLTSSLMQRSTADLGVDPASLLPVVLSYSIWPDSNAPIPIAIEIHYSNYQTINGVKVPFTIQRYINGSLQLEIDVNTAQVN